MKNLTKLLLVVSIVTGVSSCKSKKDLDSKNNNLQESAELDAPEPLPTIKDEEPVIVEKVIQEEAVNINQTENKKKEELFSMVVSFFSRGEGIDYMIARKFEKLVKEYEEAHPDEFNAERVGWGREGEIDYCIQFGNLNKNLVKEFENSSKEITDQTDRVHVKMNTECKRRRKTN